MFVAHLASMVASSSALVAVAPVANASSTLAAAASQAGGPVFNTAGLLQFGMKLPALIQTMHLPVDHLGGLQAAVEGLGSFFRLIEEGHQMGKEHAGVAFPLTQVLSHGSKMFEYPFTFVAELTIRLLFYLFSYFVVATCDILGCYVLFVSAVCVCVVCARCC